MIAIVSLYIPIIWVSSFGQCDEIRKMKFVNGSMGNTVVAQYYSIDETESYESLETRYICK